MRDMEPTFNRRGFAIGAGGAVAAAAGIASTGLAQTTSPEDEAAYFDETGRVPQDAQPSTLVVHFDVTGWVRRFTIGEFECLAVSDGASLNNDPNDIWNYYGLILGASPPDDVQTWLDAGGYDANNLMRQDTRLLVDTGDQRVLIDTGIGPAFGGVLLGNLEGAGIAAEDIDVVITTHAHPDHIGGNVDGNGAPAFPNARYVMPEEEWNFWTDDARVERAVPNEAIREVILGFVHSQMTPIADQYELIDFDEEIVPGMSSIATPGHTPGHMSLLVESAGEHLWVAADFAGHPVSMRNPALAGYADIDPEQMEATRRMMFKRMAEGGLALFGHFDPFPGLGHVSADGNAWVWTPVPNDE